MNKILAKVNAVFAEDGSCLLNVGHEKSLKADLKQLMIGDDLLTDVRRGDKIEFEGQIGVEEVTVTGGETFDGKYLICPDMKVSGIQRRPRVVSKGMRAISLGASTVEPPFASKD